MQIYAQKQPNITFHVGEWTPEMQQLVQDFPILEDKEADVFPSPLLSSEENIRLATRVMANLKFADTDFMNTRNLEKFSTAVKEFGHYLPQKKAMGIAKAFSEELASIISDPKDSTLRIQAYDVLMDLKNQEQNKFRVHTNKALFDEAARNSYNSKNKIDALSIWEPV